jgi:hypothetical protein
VFWGGLDGRRRYGSEPNARLLCRKERGTSRGSLRFPRLRSGQALQRDKAVASRMTNNEQQVPFGKLRAGSQPA